MGRRAVLFALAVALLAEGQIVDAFTAPAIISLRAPSRRLVSDRRACPPRAAETRPKNQMGGRGRPAAHIPRSDIGHATIIHYCDRMTLTCRNPTAFTFALGMGRERSPPNATLSRTSRANQNHGHGEFDTGALVVVSVFGLL